MIRLIVNPDTSSEEYIFDKDSIVIGAGITAAVDLTLPNEELQERHIQIQKQSNHHVVLNLANDPYVTLNDLPFGKKQLHANDQLQIGNTIIRFEEFTPVADNIEKKINLSTSIQSQPSPEIESEIELDLMEGSHVEDASITQKSNAQSFKETEKALPAKIRNHKAIIVTALLCFLIMIAALSAGYALITKRSDKESLIAAEGVADVAMALAYAQVNHIKPQKLNWMDPEFLTNNLASILSSEYPSFANIDNQGHFRNCPYLLRVYTSQDLSQFIVIAQPTPSLIQWINPKETVVVDSQEMEIREIYDLKPLNRLLVNPAALDSHAAEIFQEIKRSSLITLSSLGTKKGFAPPKALALFRPGAENRIYNAPRYYHFAESILRRVVNFLHYGGSIHENAYLQQQIAALSHFPNLILYSSQGLQKALEFQQVLASIDPNHNFLTAFLNFNSEGLVASSHLLFQGVYPQQNLISLTTPEANSADIVMSDATHEEDDFDPEHPLMWLLQSLAEERQNDLESSSEEIFRLLERHNKEGIEDFEKTFSVFLKQYLQVSQESEQKIKEKLSLLKQEFAFLSAEQFAAYVRAAGLKE